MSGFMVLDSNRLDNAASKTASSERAGYPASNVYDNDKRRRMWRTAGYWKVVSGPNKIIFRETLLTDLTATVAAGTYSTDASFLLAIANALNSAGGSHYTVSRDATTGRIKILSSLAGGGGIFQLIWTDPLSAVMAGFTGFSTATNLTGAAFYIADVISIHQEEWLLWNFAFPMNPTAFVAVGDRNTPLQISPTASVTLQANWTNSWAAPAEQFTIPVLDFVLAILDPAGIAKIAPAGYPWWRLQIVDPANADLYDKLGAIFLGQHRVLTRGAPAFPLDKQFKDRSVVQKTEAGNTLVAKKGKYEIFTLNWQALDKASFESLQAVWNYFGLHSSFFIAMDANSAYSTDGKTEVRLVKFASEPPAPLVSPQNWSYTWQLEEQI